MQTYVGAFDAQTLTFSTSLGMTLEKSRSISVYILSYSVYCPLQISTDSEHQLSSVGNILSYCNPTKKGQKRCFMLVEENLVPQK